VKALATVALLGWLGVSVPSRPAGAAGFSLFEQSARALGFAGAFTARVDDPSAIFFNPAGLARIDGDRLLISPNLIDYKVEFSGVNPSPGFGVEEQTESRVFPLASAYYARPLGAEVTGGLGIYSPFGLTVDWDEEDAYSGRFISTLSKVTPFYVSPTVAVALSPHWQVGAGASLVVSRVELARHLAAYNPFDDRTEDIGEVRLTSDWSLGAGWQLGAQFRPAGRWQLGATYRSRVTIDYEGDADFTQRNTGNPLFDAAVAADFPPDQRAATSFALPAQASLGIGFQASPAWALEGDLNYTGWKAFDRLVIEFEDTPSRNVSISQDWKSVLHARTGFEYRADADSRWAWRGGYYFDRSPQPTEGVGPLLPDMDRHGFTGGVGWREPDGSPELDAYLLVLLSGDRSTEGRNRDNYNGIYSAGTWIGGMSLGLRF
jgi:long-chain fatty acid transport protein